MKQFDFTPDPKVLLALTKTPMKPIDALCELIDNGIDSFASAALRGLKVSNPIIMVSLPSKSEIDNGVGKLRIVDNGPGMSDSEAERAIKAGFSGNNPYDTLGLFGMGFNISTGKMGNRTTLLTARAEDDEYIKVVIDLNKINRTKNYTLPVETVRKSKDAIFQPGQSGTIIEVDQWWPKGDSNSGFVKKLVGFGHPVIRDEIGRRYATILRDRSVQIEIDGEKCRPFEHCAWDASRSVVRNGVAIPARFDFDKVLNASRRCSKCTAVVASNEDHCPNCGSNSFRTVEERVRGWVGIQRFDSQTKYGIDLIRNGRAIRVAEKEAFFTFKNDLGKEFKDYPIDGNYGRIIGEVHLDFVPVDFMKTDFQRSSVEWQAAMEFLRGTTTLQPTKHEGEENNSYIYRLYQGYRRVRDAGRRDMYMGYWDAAAGKPKRIARAIEEEYYQRFLAKEKGYYDDSEWWKLVEAADQPPMPEFEVCAVCGSQVSKNDEVCGVCEAVLFGKQCLNADCGEEIPFSAASCPHCGADQAPKVITPWTCDVCGASNPSDNELCSVCGFAKNRINPLSPELLMQSSVKDDELSMDNLSILKTDGKHTKPIKLEVYTTNGKLQDFRTKKYTPIVVEKNIGMLRLFIDKTHPMFSSCALSVEQLVASEVAKYLYDDNSAEIGKPLHTVGNIAWSIIDFRWADNLAVDQESVQESAKNLLGSMADRLQESVGSLLSDYAESMTDDQKKAMTSAMVDAHVSFENTSALIESGAFIKFAPYDLLVTISRINPNLFFGGNIWPDPVPVSANDGFIDAAVLHKANLRARQRYLACLEDVVMMASDPTDDPDFLQVVKSSIAFLQKKMID